MLSFRTFVKRGRNVNLKDNTQGYRSVHIGKQIPRRGKTLPKRGGLVYIVLQGMNNDEIMNDKTII